MTTVTPKQKDCLEVIEQSATVELTTIDQDGFPSTRAMLNLRNKKAYQAIFPLYEAEENPLTVYLSTNTASEKIKEISANSKACLYFYQANLFSGVLLQGTVEIITDKGFKQKVWQPGWEKHYPKGEEDYSLLRFVPKNLKTYSNFQVSKEEVK
jgi:general stress protein 26